MEKPLTKKRPGRQRKETDAAAIDNDEEPHLSRDASGTSGNQIDLTG